MPARYVLCSTLLFMIALLARESSAQSGDFTIIALPDTQNEAQFFPNVLKSQTQWIIAHRQELNIQMVLGEGDIVNDFSSPAQQQSSLAAFDLLDDAHIPYMLAIGNHDYDGANPKAARLVTGFNRFFGPTRYATKPYYRGSFPAGSNENFFGVVEIGGQQFLVLVLEFVPRPESMDWAESILQANPDKQVLVLTHSFTYVDDTRVDTCDTSDMPAGNETGDDMWAVLRKYPNVFMVVSGHLTNGHAGRRADLGDQGNLVNQLFSNYQTFPHGGDGWLRIMTFHPASNSITVQTFSPSLNRFKTSDQEQFTLAYHNPHVTRGTGTISGLVRDFTTCDPIPGANLSTAGVSAVTDANGHYTFTLPPGAYTVTVDAQGFGPDARSEVVNDSFDTDMNFYLTKGNLPACALNPASPSVTICAPQNHASVVSPIQVNAASTDSTTVLSMQAMLDGKDVLDANSGRMNGLVNATPGQHTLTVIAEDAANATAQQSVEFVVSGPGFVAGPHLSMGVTPSSASISLGGSADFAVVVASDGTLGNPVTFACTNLPDGARCVFDPPKIAAAQLPGSVKMTVFASPVAAGAFGLRKSNRLIAWLALFGAVVLGAAVGRMRCRSRLNPALLALMLALALLGCAGIVTPTNRGSFTFKLVSKSGSAQTTLAISLTLK